MDDDGDGSLQARYTENIVKSLRQKAEEAAIEKEGISSRDSQVVSEDEIQQKLHELLVHQIELEMQNDELRRAQTELEEARARYLDLYDLAPAGYCTLSEDGLITEANLTAASLLGVPRGALINQPIARFICKEDQDSYYLYKMQLFETGEPQSCELQMTNRGGAPFWAHLVTNVVQGPDGELKCRVVLSDITKRRGAEEALRESERLLRAVIEGTGDPVFLKDRESRMLVANAATERTMGEMVIGKTVLDYFQDKELATAVLENDRRIMEMDRAEETEEVIPTVAGLRTFLVRKTPWHDAKGDVIGLIGIARDITIRKAMEMELINTAVELERKDRLVTDFFINISHELKTPITLITLALEIMENYMGQPELNRAGIKKRTALMRQNANRLSRLVGNILDITKIDAGFMEPKLACIDIVRLIRNLVESMEGFASKKELQIEFTSSAKTKSMPADSQIMERIILNLVSNAIKHTPQGGSIRISCLDMESKIIVSVKDNGEGIPDEKKSIIFDRFRQVNTSLTRSSEGSGIGLSLIKALVELLQGRIWFESTLGVGSEFFFELPVLLIAERRPPIEQEGMSVDRIIEMEFSDINFG